MYIVLECEINRIWLYRDRCNMALKICRVQFAIMTYGFYQWFGRSDTVGLQERKRNSKRYKQGVQYIIRTESSVVKCCALLSRVSSSSGAVPSSMFWNLARSLFVMERAPVIHIPLTYTLMSRLTRPGRDGVSLLRAGGFAFARVTGTATATLSDDARLLQFFSERVSDQPHI